MPDTLSYTLLQYCGIDEAWNVCNESVQRLADRANPFGTYIGQIQKTWIGIPLRVHRRCLDPMFKVANAIAYDNLMVQATIHKPSQLAALLPISQWVHVEGHSTGDNHWILQEGKRVVQILAYICQAYGKLPSLYIISPFKSVAHAMKKLLLENNLIPWAANLAPPAKISQWVRDSIGTIHSFQGKQAEVVILLLGGNPKKPGAISWATKTPNMLNVALTRAQHLCFVVGNYELWAKQPYFNVLTKDMPCNIHVPDTTSMVAWSSLKRR